MALAVLAAVPSAARAQSGYAGLVLHTPGLAGFWRLGETSGTVAGDAGGQAPEATSAAPVLGARGGLSADADTAARFDGVDDEMQAGGPRPARAARGLVLLGGRRGADARQHDSGGWILAFDSGGQVAYRVGGTTFTTRAGDRGPARRLASRRADGRGRSDGFYVDGEPVHTGTAAGHAPVALPWHVMRNGDDGPVHARASRRDRGL